MAVDQKPSISGKPALTLVFLHYFGGSAASWNWVIKELEADYTCLALDLPGFGGTAKLPNPSLRAYANHVFSEIDKAQIDKYIFIGHSMGGKIAIQCAIDEQNKTMVNKEGNVAADEGRIKQLILVAPSPPSIERIPAEKQEEMKKDPDQQAAEQSVKSAIHINLDAEKWATAVATPQQVNPAARKWWIDEGTKHSIAEQCIKLKLPVHLILADKDPAITTEMSDQETLPNLPPLHTMIRNPESGHLIPLEDPSWLASQIQSLLALTRKVVTQ